MQRWVSHLKIQDFSTSVSETCENVYLFVFISQVRQTNILNFVHYNSEIAVAHLGFNWITIVSHSQQTFRICIKLILEAADLELVCLKINFFESISRNKAASMFIFTIISLRRKTEVFLVRRCSSKKRLQHRCFPVTFAKFLRTPFLKNISKQRLLDCNEMYFWNTGPIIEQQVRHFQVSSSSVGSSRKSERRTFFFDVLNIQCEFHQIKKNTSFGESSSQLKINNFVFLNSRTKYATFKYSHKEYFFYQKQPFPDVFQNRCS